MSIDRFLEDQRKSGERVHLEKTAKDVANCFLNYCDYQYFIQTPTVSIRDKGSSATIKLFYMARERQCEPVGHINVTFHSDLSVNEIEVLCFSENYKDALDYAAAQIKS